MTRLSRLPVWLLLLAAALLISFPLALYGGYGNPAAAFYASALDQFSHAFWYGDEPYPRLLDHANGDLGSPVFFFYPPVAFWLSALLEPLARVDPSGMARLGLSLFLATLASGFTCYRWLAAKHPHNLALLGALIYVLMPLRLIYLYVDCNLAQCWAVAWFPLILLAIDRIMLGRPRAGVACAACYSLLLMTHVPSFLIFLPLSLIYGALQTSDAMKQSWAQLGVLLLCVLLALGLGSVYLVPLAALHFVMNASEGPFAGTRLSASEFILPDLDALLLFMATVAVWVYRMASPEIRRQLRPWLILLGVTSVMMTSLSQPLWERIMLLHYVMLPAHRMAAALFPIAAVLGMWIMPMLPGRICFAACTLLFGAVIALSPLAGGLTQTPAEDAGQPNLHRIAPARFLTRWVAPEEITPQALAALHATPDVSITAGNAHADVQSWLPRSITLSVHVASPEARLALKRFYFPGWRALKDNVPADYGITPTRGGQMGVGLPKGDYTLLLLLDHVPGEAAGWCLTLLSLCIVVAWMAVSSVAGRPRRSAL